MAWQGWPSSSSSSATRSPDGRPVALEALQHDRGALVVQAHQLHRVDQPGQRLAGQAAAAGEAPTPAAPSRRGRPGPRGRGSRSRSAGGRRRRARARARTEVGSVRWTWTEDAQTLSRKVWASPVSRSSALRARSRRCRPCRRASVESPSVRRRPCRRRRWSHRRWHRSSHRRCRRRPCRRRRCPGRTATPVGSTPSVVISSSPRGLSGVVVMDPPHRAATDGPPGTVPVVGRSPTTVPHPSGRGEPPDGLRRRGPRSAWCP